MENLIKMLSEQIENVQKKGKMKETSSLQAYTRQQINQMKDEIKENIIIS